MICSRGFLTVAVCSSNCNVGQTSWKRWCWTSERFRRGRARRRMWHPSSKHLGHWWSAAKCWMLPKWRQLAQLKRRRMHERLAHTPNSTAGVPNANGRSTAPSFAACRHMSMLSFFWRMQRWLYHRATAALLSDASFARGLPEMRLVPSREARGTSGRRLTSTIIPACRSTVFRSICKLQCTRPPCGHMRHRRQSRRLRELALRQARRPRRSWSARHELLERT